jgi:excisionase family DNA binding protein
MSKDDPNRLTYTVAEAAQLLGISREFAYQQVKSGDLPSVQLGRRRLIPRVALDRFLSGGAA